MKTIPPAGFPYRWCSNSGEDEFGIWLEFAVKGISQRMRWMNPGHFLMGSPSDEIHRHHSESQHDRFLFPQRRNGSTHAVQRQQTLFILG
jgi:hypothetical protein